MDNKIAAKEMALKLRMKAELLESLDEKQLAELKNNAKEQVDGGCWLSTPCIMVECFVISPS